MRVYDVCEVKVAGRVLGFVCDAKIKEANPLGELLLDASVLHEQWLENVACQVPSGIFIRL